MERPCVPGNLQEARDQVADEVPDRGDAEADHEHIEAAADHPAPRRCCGPRPRRSGRPCWWRRMSRSAASRGSIGLAYLAWSMAGAFAAVVLSAFAFYAASPRYGALLEARREEVRRALLRRS